MSIGGGENNDIGGFWFGERVFLRARAWSNRALFDGIRVSLPLSHLFLEENSALHPPPRQ
jgi:hypothetical protein